MMFQTSLLSTPRKTSSSPSSKKHSHALSAAPNHSLFLSPYNNHVNNNVGYIYNHDNKNVADENSTKDDASLKLELFVTEATTADGYQQHIARAPFIDAADGDLEELLLKKNAENLPVAEFKENNANARADHSAAEAAAAAAAVRKDILAGLKDAADTGSTESEELTGWKKFARTVLPHIGLVLLTCTYTLIGASIFYSIEHRYERDLKQYNLDQIYQTKASFLRKMWTEIQQRHGQQHVGNLTEENFMAFGEENLQNLTELIAEACVDATLSLAEIRENRTREVWTFPTAIFFAVTVVTTIGYGTPVPLTFSGRLVCIFFAVIGVPLTLMTIADVGKFFSEHLILLYGCYLQLQLKIQRKLKRLRRSRAEDRVCDKCRHSNNPPGEQQSVHQGHKEDHGHQHHRRRSSTTNGSHSIGGARRGSVAAHAQDYFNNMFDDYREETVPATLLLAIFVGYTALGGLLLQYCEAWTFFESFYFSFITMTTIGFGDLVPTKDGHIFVILLYLIFGLVITTMCIDLVGVHYLQKIHYFGKKIQDARSALAIVGGKVVLVSELYASLLAKRHGIGRDQLGLIPDAFIIENLYLTKHLIPYIPRDIKRIRYIDEGTDSVTSSSSYETYSCKYCHNRMCSRVSHNFLNVTLPGGHHNV